MSEPTIEKIVVYLSDGTTKTIDVKEAMTFKSCEELYGEKFNQIWDVKDYWA